MTVYPALLYCHPWSLTKLSSVTGVPADDDDLVGEHDEHHRQAHQGQHRGEDGSVNLGLIGVTVMIIFSVFAKEISKLTINNVVD